VRPRNGSSAASGSKARSRASAPSRGGPARRAPTVLLTGQADDDAIRRAWDNAKVSDVIRKPWSAETLRTAIEGALPRG
jgi:response regulator RpfG family c-di-GMP phosphodiesterase